MPANVLLIVLDTARADVFEPYGARAGSTPAVAGLARSGQVVEHAHAPASWTVPSHASLLTGQLPRELGLAQVPGGHRHLCKPRMEAARDRYLPAVLSEAGYDVRGLSANPWISEGSGFAEGFRTFEDVHTTRRGGMHEAGNKARVKWLLEAFVAKVDDGASAAAEVVDRWIADGPREPFFWFVNLLECHSPYLPPKPYNSLNAYQRLVAAEEARTYLTFSAVVQACLGLVEIPPAALARMRVLYEDSIRLMDRWIERVLDALDAKGLLDSTQVIVTSDHGENLGEQQLIGHGFSLDNRLIRVPLVTSGPVTLDLDPLSSLVDVPRSLADGLGLQDHPWAGDAPTDGIVVAQFDAIGDADAPEMAGLEAWGLTDEAKRRVLSDITCASDGRWKLVRDGDREHLYDLSSDPLEQSPIDAADDAPIERLRAAVDRAEHRPDHVAGPVAPVDEVSSEEAAELEEQMRLLGYL